MIEAARPGLLAAGLLLALVPLALHFLVPRERRTRLLPTARFLKEDARVRVRLRRTPTHPGLLALRMALLVAAGGALAGLRWVGSSEGTGTLVVVDAGHADPDGRRARVEAAVARVRDDPTVVGLLAVTLGPDRLPSARRVTPEALATSAAGPGETRAPVRAAHLLRALRDEAGRVSGLDSLRAVLVMTPDPAAAGPGLVELRDALWPGRIEVVVPDHVREPDPSAGLVEVHAEPGDRETIEAAAEVAGFTLAAPAPVQLLVGPPSLAPDLWAEDGEEWPPPVAGARLLLLDGRSLRHPGRTARGTPRPGTVVPVLLEGGRPAGAAEAGPEAACRVLLPLDGDVPLEATADLPVLIEAVIGVGCRDRSVARARAASPDLVALLEGGRDGPDRAGEGSGDAADPVPLRELEGRRAGTPLVRPLIALALLLAVVETALVRGRDRTGLPDSARRRNRSPTPPTAAGRPTAPTRRTEET